LLCDRCLLSGYAAGARQIGRERVADAALELLATRRRVPAARALWRGAAVAVAFAAAVVAGTFTWQRLVAPGLHHPAAYLPQAVEPEVAPAAPAEAQSEPAPAPAGEGSTAEAAPPAPASESSG
ncbi:MAG: hypothetical protein V3U03_11885, partial [Myxococcota bacterium]